MSVLAIRPYTLTFTYLLIYLGLYYMERLPHLRRKVRAKHQFDWQSADACGRWNTWSMGTGPM